MVYYYYHYQLFLSILRPILESCDRNTFAALSQCMSVGDHDLQRTFRLPPPHFLPCTTPSVYHSTPFCLLRLPVSSSSCCVPLSLSHFTCRSHHRPHPLPPGQVRHPPLLHLKCKPQAIHSLQWFFGDECLRQIVLSRAQSCDEKISGDGPQSGSKSEGDLLYINMVTQSPSESIDLCAPSIYKGGRTSNRLYTGNIYCHRQKQVYSNLSRMLTGSVASCNCRSRRVLLSLFQQMRSHFWKVSRNTNPSGLLQVD